MLVISWTFLFYWVPPLLCLFTLDDSPLLACKAYTNERLPRDSNRSITDARSALIE